MNDNQVGAIRTIVQAVAGFIVAQLFQRWGIEVDAAALELVLFAIATGLWRQLWTVLGRRWPWLEILNGWAAKPNYELAA